MKLEGQCACGNVTYKFDGAPWVVCECHCLDCQRSTGGSFAYLLVLDEKLISVTGQLKQYVSEDRKHIARNFCGNCGTMMFSHPSSVPGALILSGGTIEGERPRPTFAMFAKRMHPWTNSDLKHYPANVHDVPKEDLLWKPPSTEEVME